MTYASDLSEEAELSQPFEYLRDAAESDARGGTHHEESEEGPWDETVQAFSLPGEAGVT